jgi:hypothetical protein
MFNYNIRIAARPGTVGSAGSWRPGSACSAALREKGCSLSPVIAATSLTLQGPVVKPNVGGGGEKLPRASTGRRCPEPTREVAR